MDILQRIWPSLADNQRRLLEDMALALAGVAPRKPTEWMSVSQIADEYGCSVSGVYKAMDTGRLEYSVPNGQTKPRHARRQDVETWLGIAT